MQRLNEQDSNSRLDAEGLDYTALEAVQHDEVLVNQVAQQNSRQGTGSADSSAIEIKTSRILITIHPDQAEPEIIVRNPEGSVLQIVRVPLGATPDLRNATSAPHVRISKMAYSKLRETVGRLPAERGGIFVGPDPFCVEDFIFDDGKKAKQSAVYYPDTTYLNRILEGDHEPHGRRFVGLAHSHPNGYWRPSGGDVKASRNNLMAKSNADLPALFIPIVESMATSGRFELHPFIMFRHDFQVRSARYEVID